MSDPHIGWAPTIKYSSEEYLGLLAPNHDFIFQMDVQNYNNLLVTWLKEEMLDIGEQNI